MRYFYDGSGTDISATAPATLLATTNITIHDLYSIQFINPGNAVHLNAPLWTNIYFTSGPQPIFVESMQLSAGPNGTATVNATFLPTKIQHGDINFEVGFKDQTLEVTWYPDDSLIIPQGSRNINVYNYKQAFEAGFFDDIPMWVHQAYLQPSDVPNTPPTLYATTLIWRGFIKASKVDRGQIVISLASLLNIIQETQVPTQTIQPGSRMPPFQPMGNVSIIGGSLGADFLNTSTPLDLQFTVPLPYADGSLKDSYIIGYSQPPPTWYYARNAMPQPVVFRIRDNYTDGDNVLHIYMYEPIDPPDLIVGYGSGVYVNIFTQTETGTTGAISPGFPYVPRPEDGY